MIQLINRKYHQIQTDSKMILKISLHILREQNIHLKAFLHQILINFVTVQFVLFVNLFNFELILSFQTFMLTQIIHSLL